MDARAKGWLMATGYDRLTMATMSLLRRYGTWALGTLRNMGTAAELAPAEVARTGDATGSVARDVAPDTTGWMASAVVRAPPKQFLVALTPTMVFTGMAGAPMVAMGVGVGVGWGPGTCYTCAHMKTGLDKYCRARGRARGGQRGRRRTPLFLCRTW